MKTLSTLSLSFALALSLAACDQKPAAPKDDHGHDHAAGDGHDHKEGDGHDHEGHDHGHGPKTELGSQSAGGLTVVAAREGDVTPGGEASFDVSVSGGTKPATVRAWVGTQDGKGSIKGKAEVEGDGWHVHAEVPKPLPTGSKLWVELELSSGEKHVVSFDLKS